MTRRLIGSDRDDHDVVDAVWYHVVIVASFGTTFLILCLALIILMSSIGWSHDHTRPQLDAWYRSLVSGKGPCCDGPGKDAQHLSVDEWKRESDHYEVFLDGHWIKVPSDAILTQPNEDGRALVWPTYEHGERSVRCFLPGVLT